MSIHLSSVYILQNDGNFLNTNESINFEKTSANQKYDSLELSELCCSHSLTGFPLKISRMVHVTHQSNR